eukprot:NODE_2218_length_974_cov_248.495103.p2 GENE.NODE_2218_length_974_cov_248.495103~~NODE_2218_length_974_cov_248.495103.p2  ORF type:complete len:223 (+),score=82.44 NODE_2218_length_974_cov_248.495103:95-670(+)
MVQYPAWIVPTSCLTNTAISSSNLCMQMFMESVSLPGEIHTEPGDDIASFSTSCSGGGICTPADDIAATAVALRRREEREDGLPPPAGGSEANRRSAGAWFPPAAVPATPFRNAAVAAAARTAAAAHSGCRNLQVPSMRHQPFHFQCRQTIGLFSGTSPKGAAVAPAAPSLRCTSSTPSQPCASSVAALNP